MNEEKQKSIVKSTELHGTGLHSGVESRITFKPAPEGHGLVFRRIDLEGLPEVHARVDNVVFTERGTVISQDDVRVRTVEHILSAVAALEIDNLLIELDGEEPPACDGSSAPFTAALVEAGIATLRA